MAVMPGVRPRDLGSSGWGVVFAEGTPPEVKEALGPLLEHRRVQAAPYYREFTGSDGVQPVESKSEFLARHGAGPGPVNPRKAPYYLLIVGGPEAISFDFQRQLGVQYAVGRINFDSFQEYEQYARNVVELESSSATQPRRAAFFGTQHPDDLSTRYSLEYLNLPLLESLSQDRSDWQVNSYLRDAATKAQLGRLLGGEDRHTLLFTTGHGMGFPRSDERHLAHSGALLCQDWPGPGVWEHDRAVPGEHYFSADDIDSSADLSGMITFHQASFSAGLPEKSLGYGLPASCKTLARRPFVSRLPQRLLGRSRGALAFIGHVDRAWGFSSLWSGAGNQPDPFEAVLKSLMGGEPVGYAMRYFGDRYGQLAVDLSATLAGDRAATKEGKAGNELSNEIVDLWTATNDSRSYAVLGDPAVRLKVT